MKWPLHFIFNYSLYVQIATQHYKEDTARRTSEINPVTIENLDDFCYKCIGKPSCGTTVNQNLALSAKMNGTQKEDTGKSMKNVL